MAPGPGKKWDLLIINANLATMTSNGMPYGAIPKGALAITDRSIAWLGSMQDLPDAPDACAAKVLSAGGHWVTPGLIDCHTHLIFAGSRAGEFEQRLNGVSYEEIARQGGGIVSTVKATREADESTLVELAAERLRHLCAEGVTTVEIKSGYGLETESELRILRAARRLSERQPIEVRPTFLGAHAVPSEYRGRDDSYIDLVCEEMLPAVAEQRLACAVDAYCEGIGFSSQQTRRVFRAAADLGLPVKLHADQFSDTGGAALAAEFGALSADHLEYTSADGLQAMAKAGTVGVLLPGAFHTLRETQMPAIEQMRDLGVPMAVATDCNPGSSPLSSLLTAMNMACQLFGLTPEEALRGGTIAAAQALGMDEFYGSLEVGKRADLALWDIAEPAELCYWIGGRRCRSLFKFGQQVF